MSACQRHSPRLAYTHRFEVLLSHPNVSSALRTALFQLMSLITKSSPYSTTKMAMLAVKTYEVVADQMITVKTDKELMNQLSLQCRQCLAIIEAVNFKYVFTYYEIEILLPIVYCVEKSRAMRYHRG